jgi:hypothetical protein
LLSTPRRCEEPEEKEGSSSSQLFSLLEEEIVMADTEHEDLQRKPLH